MDTLQFRNALGQFATGVCLISLCDANGRAMALTANSFSSVSLDPPLVLWSLQKSSEVYAQFAGSQQFAISVLNADQEPLSTQYATRGDHLMPPAHFLPGRNGAPLVRGALASFECDLYAAHDAGDHTILVGEVTHFSAAASRRPLLFHLGRYGQLA